MNGIFMNGASTNAGNVDYWKFEKASFRIDSVIKSWFFNLNWIYIDAQSISANNAYLSTLL